MVDIDIQQKKFRRELSSGTVSLALLAILAKADSPLYGYQIAKRFEGEGESLLSGKQSALYPVLRNLESSGFLQSHVEPSASGPPRRYYAITGGGRAALGEWMSTWRATRDFIDSLLGAVA